METFSINIQKLCKEYYGEGETVRVLNELEFQLPPASLASVEGASGVGKSTLLNIIGTIDNPTSGSMEIMGEDVTRMSLKERENFRARQVGLIFQNYNLLNDFTVEENVMMPLLIQRQKFSVAREQAVEKLNLVGLGHRLKHYPNQISGGEMARCGVARALVGDKKLILADEPTGNLDRQNSTKLIDLLFDIQKELKFTLLIVTHDLELAKRIPRRFVLKAGKIHNQLS